MTARARQAGFTLVEVLVTLLVMGFIMTAMTMILDSARTSRDTIYNIRETQLAGPAIMDLIERDLRAILTYDRDPATALRVTDRVLLGRDADSIDFVTAGPARTPVLQRDRFVRPAVNEVGYRLRENPQNDDFLEIYRREDPGIDDEPFDGGTYSLLHDRVRHFDVQVFTEDGPDAEPESEWGTGRDEDKVGLPARLEIRLEVELAPRIMKEQLKLAPVDKRRVVYRRVIRLPEVLREAEEIRPVPRIPEIEPLQSGAE